MNCLRNTQGIKCSYVCTTPTYASSKQGLITALLEASWFHLALPGVVALYSIYSGKTFGNSLLSISLTTSLEQQLILRGLDALAVVLGVHRGVFDFPGSQGGRQKSMSIRAHYKHRRIQGIGRPRIHEKSPCDAPSL
jgi:hypothetical protein